MQITLPAWVNIVSLAATQPYLSVLRRVYRRMSGFIPSSPPSPGPSKIFDHSKAAGYAALVILLAAFVSWAKYALISDYALYAVFGAAVMFFVLWRAISGTWPGNDPK